MWSVVFFSVRWIKIINLYVPLKADDRKRKAKKTVFLLPEWKHYQDIAICNMVTC